MDRDDRYRHHKTLDEGDESRAKTERKGEDTGRLRNRHRPDTKCRERVAKLGKPLGHVAGMLKLKERWLEKTNRQDESEKKLGKIPKSIQKIGTAD